MTILTEGALVVANATAIKVSTRKAVRTDIKVENWVGTVLVRRGASESWLFPSKVSVKVSILQFLVAEVENLNSIIPCH